MAGKRATLGTESSDELRGEMLRVSRRPAIAEHQQLSAGRECLVDQIDSPADGLRIRALGDRRHVAGHRVEQVRELVSHYTDWTNGATEGEADMRVVARRRTRR